MAAWLVPSIFYVVLVGSMGVTSKLAQQTISWQQLFLWVGIVYVVIVAGFVAFGNVRPTAAVGSLWGILTAVLAGTSLIAFFYALGRGDATAVVPVTAAAPLVTLLLAAAFLSESVTVPRVLGTLLVVGGVVLITR